MKRKLTLLLTVLFTIFSLPISGLTVLADEKTYDDIEDGTYEIKAYAKKAGTNDASTAADYMSDDATLTVKNGEAELTLFIPDNVAMIFKKLEVAGVEPTITPAELDSEEGNYYTYNIPMLQSILNAVTTYEVPMINLVHENVELDFHLEGLDELPVKEEPVIEVKTETVKETIAFETVEEKDSSLEKGKTKVDQKGVDGTKEITYEVTYTDGEETNRKIKDESITKEPKDEIILVGTKEQKPEPETGSVNIKDGEYGITAKALHEDKDEPSGAAGFINEDATLTIKDGKASLTIGVPANEMALIEGVQVEGKKGTVEKEADVTYYTFKLDELNQELNSRVQYNVPAIGLEHDVAFRFILEGLDELPVKDETKVEVKTETKTESIKYNTIEKKDSSLEKGKTKVKQKGVNGEKEVTYEITYTDGKETKRTVKEESVTKKSVDKVILVGTKDVKKKSDVKDGTYEIIAKAMHATKDEPSGAAQFINEKAQIVIKDGVIQLVITVPHNDMAEISGIQIEGKEASVEETNESNVYTFTLDSLKEVLNSKVQYKVPSLGMDHDVEFRFVLEGLDKLPIKVEEPNQNPNQEENTDDDLEKPKFGLNDEDGQKVAASTNGGPKNPQTGDTSSILFYTLLLIGSMIPLAVKFRRRFV